MKRIALFAAFVTTLVPVAGRGTPASMADVWRDRVSVVARSVGLEPADVLSSEVALTLPGRDGSPVLHRATLDEWFEVLGGGSVPASGGIAGLPEITAGDFVHTYLTFGIGISTAYEVTTSSVVPPTPSVYPPSPADLLLFEAGGPLTQVKGSYDDGHHTVGTVIGSNVDTGEGGPYLPRASSGVVEDSSIDFVGHVDTLDETLVCLFGICVLAIGLLIGDGVVIWDTADPTLPIIP